MELEGGHQRKVHVDHLIRQAPGCPPVSSEPVPVVTGEEPLNTSEPSDCESHNNNNLQQAVHSIDLCWKSFSKDCANLELAA